MVITSRTYIAPYFQGTNNVPQIDSKAEKLLFVLSSFGKIRNEFWGKLEKMGWGGVGWGGDGWGEFERKRPMGHFVNEACNFFVVIMILVCH